MSSHFGMTPEGFEKKRLDDLVTALEGHFQAVYGANFKVGPETKQGQIIANFANELASLWDAAEDSYNSFNPSAAMGKALSDLVQYNLLTRQPATESQAQLTITGTPGTIIPLGSQAEVEETGEKFATTLEVTIPGGGTVIVASEAAEVGQVVAPAGTINIIFTPVTGWDTVTNVADAIVGTLEESNEELRTRRNNSTAFNAQNIVESTASQLLSLDDVIHVAVLENDTNVTDGDGVPPHSGEAIVGGGLDAEIGAVLMRNKIPGIPWVGTTNVPTTDSQGFPVDINFTRPVDIPIKVTVTIVTTPIYPANGDDLIKENILSYAAGTLVQGRGFSVGDDVVTSELYTPANLVPGHTITTLEIAKVPDALDTANVPITVRELSTFDISDLVVIS